MLTFIIYGTVIAGGFTLLLWLPNAVLDFAAEKLAEADHHDIYGSAQGDCFPHVTIDLFHSGTNNRTEA